MIWSLTNCNGFLKYLFVLQYFDIIADTTRAPKPSERDGVDYHFVNKQVFRAKLDEGEILDHYEVERHLYGTSVSAIRTVARNNKACMLCLHPKVAYYSMFTQAMLVL